ncbi:hypothetical protein ACFO3D_15340 [Virgibacillus kekensis]|uniref:TNase-like domain-containing protein n=1 Tax=Virgibacillus kekensis TaxID=202261 RepID=A0ABV9DLE7_9BACI
MNFNEYAVGYVMKARQAEVQKKANERGLWLDGSQFNKRINHKHGWLQLFTKFISH